MSNLKEFQFHTFTLEIVEIDGVPWFITRPLAEYLGYKNPARDIRSNVDEDQVQNKYISIKSNNYTLINESGLYSLLIRSNKPEARTFKSWITHEVLPSIRNRGYYIDQHAKPETENSIPFDDMPKELPPFQTVKPSLLIKLGKMSKSLAQGYLIECGVTPDYVQSLLSTLGNAAPVLGVSKGESAEALVTRFIADWQAQVLAVPFAPCLGTQAIRLLRVWMEQNAIENYAGDNLLMSAIYQHPAVYSKRMRISRGSQESLRAMLMIKDEKPPVDMQIIDWLAENVARMEAALTNLEGDMQIIDWLAENVARMEAALTNLEGD